MAHAATLEPRERTPCALRAPEILTTGVLAIASSVVILLSLCVAMMTVSDAAVPGSGSPSGQAATSPAAQGFILLINVAVACCFLLVILTDAVALRSTNLVRVLSHCGCRKRNVAPARQQQHQQHPVVPHVRIV